MRSQDRKMNKLFLFGSLALMIVVASSCVEKSQSDLKSKEWKLVWEENFDSDVLDLSVWSKIPRGKSDWNNFMSSHDTLFAIEDGKLILRGMENTLEAADTATYLTGGVYTKDKKVFGNGRVEIRAKLNPATGAWPAIWMLPENAKYPLGGEIDIMERLNYENRVYQTIHTPYTLNLGIKDNPVSGTIVNLNPNEYNVYGVEKYPDSLVFLVNGRRTHTYPRIKTDKEGQFPFSDHSFYLLIDMQLGGSWVGGVDAKELPVEMHVDWVRFYELNEE